MIDHPQDFIQYYGTSSIFSTLGLPLRIGVNLTAIIFAFACNRLYKRIYSTEKDFYANNLLVLICLVIGMLGGIKYVYFWYVIGFGVFWKFDIAGSKIGALKIFLTIAITWPLWNCYGHFSQ